MIDPNQLFREIAGDVAADRLEVSPVTIDGRHGFQAQIKGTAWKCSITTGYDLDADDEMRILGDLACLATQDYPFGVHPDCDPDCVRPIAVINDRIQRLRALFDRMTALPDATLSHLESTMNLMESLASEAEGMTYIHSMLKSAGRSINGASSDEEIFDEQEKRIAKIYGRKTVLL